jgi:hypothetical protein
MRSVNVYDKSYVQFICVIINPQIGELADAIIFLALIPYYINLFYTISHTSNRNMIFANFRTNSSSNDMLPFM